MICNHLLGVRFPLGAPFIMANVEGQKNRGLIKMRLNISIIKKIITIFILVVIFQPAFAITELEKAQQLISEDKLQEALESTNKILAEDRGNIQARFIKGLVLTKMNQFDEAEKIFLDLTTEHPKLPEPYNNLAVIYAAQGQYEKARKVLLEAISTHPSYATAHENIGDIYAKMASQAYNKALQLDEGNQTAREKLSLIGELFSAPAPAPVVAQKENREKQEEKIAVVREDVSGLKPVKENKTTKQVVEQNVVPVDENNETLKNDIIQTINDWADAWSSQQVGQYLGFYASEFQPPDNMTRSNWEQLRSDRLKAPGFINVKLSQPAVTFHGKEHASVSFLQSYRSDTYNDRINKTLLMKNINGRWMIVEERSN